MGNPAAERLKAKSGELREAKVKGTRSNDFVRFCPLNASEEACSIAGKHTIGTGMIV
jgi:hypothetical protein